MLKCSVSKVVNFNSGEYRIMKYEAIPAEKSTVKITMTFTAEEWSEANDKAYLANRKKYAVNGFRKGKVPKHVLELYYGKGLFYEDALNMLFSEHYEKTLEEGKIDAVGQPSVSLGDDFSEENIVLVATVPVKPDVQIEKYTGIKVNKFEYTVTDADVEADIASTQLHAAENVEVTDRPAQNGDIVHIDFEGKVDGVAFEGGTAQGFDLELGSHRFIPGFEEGVVGMAVGETKDIGVTFPEDYQAEELKGKPAVFTVTLHKITGKKLPELDDEFAKKYGSETMEKYRAAVRERLEKNAETRSRNETENSIITEIAKGATAEIPDAMIEQREEDNLRRLEYNLMSQGIRPEDYYSYIGTTRDEYKKNFEEDARRTVLHQLIVEKIIALEKIEATKEEVDARVAEQAASVGKEPEVYRASMDPRQFEYIEADIKVGKLFDFLTKNNELVLFTEEKPAAEESAEPAEAAQPAPAKKPRKTKKESE